MDDQHDDERFHALEAVCLDLYVAGGLPEVLRFAVAAAVLFPRPLELELTDGGWDDNADAQPLSDEARDLEIMRNLLAALRRAYERDGTVAALHELAQIGHRIGNTFEKMGLCVWTGLQSVTPAHCAPTCSRSFPRDERRNRRARRSVH